MLVIYSIANKSVARFMSVGEVEKGRRIISTAVSSTIVQKHGGQCLTPDSMIWHRDNRLPVLHWVLDFLHGIKDESTGGFKLKSSFREILCSDECIDSCHV
jgi:hypothetical protein